MVPIKQCCHITGRKIISIINTPTENLGLFTLIVHTTLNTYVRDISDTHYKNQAFPIAIYVCVSIMMDIPLHLHAVRRTNYHCINSLWWVGQECLFTTSHPTSDPSDLLKLNLENVFELNSQTYTV